MRPNRLRTIASTLVSTHHIYYKWRGHESCANRVPARIGPFSFPKHNAGAFLPNRALSRVFAVVAIASLLAMGNSWARSQQGAPGAQDPTQQKQSPLQQESSCVGSTIQKITFPGVNETDQQMLRSMIPTQEGKPLGREQLQESLRILFATGRFSELSAECEPAANGDQAMPASPQAMIALDHPAARDASCSDYRSKDILPCARSQLCERRGYP